MAEDRRARLAALAAKAGRNSEQQRNDDDIAANEGGSKKVLKFRNYTPKDATLDSANADSQTGEGENDIERNTKRSKTSHDDNDAKTKPKTELEQALLQAKVDAALTMKQQQEEAGNSTATEVTAIAPKKVNWDLKRDIAKKLNRLEKRTQKAIVELLRERLEREAEEQGDDDDEDEDLD
mmetsp:Transcript_12732/g.16133  ORF Transcript_12732/g.16133 Transcript_12732/m.16133 type:complete len:180 (+) Transcript_12732:114-653(+)